MSKPNIIDLDARRPLPPPPCVALDIELGPHSLAVTFQPLGKSIDANRHGAAYLRNFLVASSCTVDGRPLNAAHLATWSDFDVWILAAAIERALHARLRAHRADLL